MIFGKLRFALAKRRHQNKINKLMNLYRDEKISAAQYEKRMMNLKFNTRKFKDYID